MNLQEAIEEFEKGTLEITTNGYTFHIRAEWTRHGDYKFYYVVVREGVTPAPNEWIETTEWIETIEGWINCNQVSGLTNNSPKRNLV